MHNHFFQSRQRSMFLPLLSLTGMLFLMLFLPSPAAAQGVGIPLGPPQVLATGIDGAHSVYAGDMDGDGDLDVVVASRMDGRIRLLRNDGAPAPGFAVRTVAELPGAYMAIPVDINQDGHLDIAAVAVETVQPSAQPNGADAPAANGSVVWLENNGASNPEFALHRIADGLDYPVSIFAGDMDNDGDIDLLSASRNDNQVRWYRNDGATNPGFSAITINDGALGAVSVHAGDLDGDGNLDIVSASEDDDQIAWYRNDGSDSPVFSRQIIRSAGGVTPVGIDLAKSVFIADLDGDGDPDIAYASENANEIGWYENDGAPMPGFLQHVVATNLDHIKQVYAADLDLDGDNDLFSASSGDGRIVWYENDGSDDPLFTQHIVVEGAAGARSVSVADLDQDGDPDILAAARDANEVYWFENQTIHRNARYTPLPNMFLAPQTAPRHAIGSDIDGDGDTDILSIGHSALIWHENDGGRPPAFTPHVIDSEIAGGRWVEAGDLDNDGDPDIVAASLNNQLLRWYINQGNGQFTPRTVARDFIFPRAVIAADLNNNHDLDLVAASDENNAIFWFANDGADIPHFATYLITDQAGYARSVFVADVNGDGDPDVLSAAQQMGEIAWYENNGAYWPDFRRHVIVSGREDEKLPDGAGGVWWPNGAQHVHAADLDADGDMDVLSVSEHDSTIAWYENDGNDPPSFTLHFISRTARGVHAVYTGDADQDGDIDVMAAIEYDHEIAWYENDGRRDAPPQFAYHKIYDQALTAHSVHANDVDGDGDLDLIATARSNDNVLWFENLGGQYRIQLMDQLTGSLIGGQSNSLMRVRVLHRGRRPLDASFYLGKLSVIFQDGRSSPMTTDQLRAVLPRLAVYRDSDGNGQFDADRDALITQTADYVLEDDGLLTLNFSRTNPDIQLEPGTFKDYFLVGDVSGACGDATPRIQVALVTNSGVFSAQDDRPLLPEFSRSVTGEDTPYEQEPLALQINEFMADNVSVMPDPDEPGEFPDWIELYNRSAFPMDIGGLYLSDNPDQPTRYRIPDGVTVPGRGYIVFIADGEFTQGPLHTNFRLAKGGESVALFDRDEANNQLIDIHTYGAVEADQSIGRLHDNAEEWEILPVPSPGSMNVDAPLDRQFFLPAVRLEIGC